MIIAIISLTIIYYIITLTLEFMSVCCPARLNPLIACLGYFFKAFSAKAIEEERLKQKGARLGMAGAAAALRTRSAWARARARQRGR